MKVTRLYTGDDGKSHFEEIEYELHDSPVGRVSERLEVLSMVGAARVGAFLATLY